MKKHRKDISSNVSKNEFASRSRRIKENWNKADSCLKKNTQIMYNLINILRDHWNKSMFFLRSNENIIMRSKRVDHSSLNNDENNDDNDDENDEA